MPRPDTTIALAVVSDKELVCQDDALTKLQAATVEQFRIIGRMRGEEAIRSLLAGLMLHRIKASLPYGEFGKWTKQHLQQFGDRWVNYLMRLALVFVENCKITKPLMLAMPGDQTELQLDGMQGQQRAFYERAMKFVGRLSISELLDKHGIKQAKKLGGARSAGQQKGEAAPIDPEQLAAHARTEISEAIELLRQLLLTDNVCQYLSAEEISAADESLHTILKRWRAALKKS
jgi:hypothetical protein